MCLVADEKMECNAFSIDSQAEDLPSICLSIDFLYPALYEFANVYNIICQSMVNISHDRP